MIACTTCHRKWGERHWDVLDIQTCPACGGQLVEIKRPVGTLAYTFNRLDDLGDPQDLLTDILSLQAAVSALIPQMLADEVYAAEKQDTLARLTALIITNAMYAAKATGVSSNDLGEALVHATLSAPKTDGKLTRTQQFLADDRGELVKQYATAN